MSIAAKPATSALRAHPRPLARHPVAAGPFAPHPVATPARTIRRIAALALVTACGLALLVAGVTVAALHTLSRFGR